MNRPASARPGRRERNKQANRDAILAAARKVFLKLGYDAVTVRDIIRGTDLASGTFYNYFEDKEEVLRALVEAAVLALTAQLREVRRSARSLDDFVCQAYRAAFTAVAREPEIYYLLRRNESVIRHLYEDSVMGISTRALREDIREAIRRGIMPALDADYLAAAFFGAGYEMARVLAESPRKDPEAAARFATRLFIGGIQSFAGGDSASLKPRVRVTGKG